MAKRAFTTTHIQLVIFENEGYAQIIGSKSAPYITGLSKTWANMTNSHAIGHPSQPNYLALFSGSTQGVAGDSCPHTFHTTSLGGQLLAAGLTFTGYAESMPHAGFTGCSADNGLYRRKHVPWPNFPDVPGSDSLVYPGALTSAPASFTWVTPNMCDDMHDCSISTGDTWAKSNLPKLITWDSANNGVLILTFDENTGTPGNQIPTILMGNVNKGSYNQDITHYSVLRTIEDVFGLSVLGKAGSASPINNVVR